MKKDLEKYKKIYPKLLSMLKENEFSQEVIDMRAGIALLFSKMSSGEKIDAINWWAKTYNVVEPWRANK